MALIKHFTLPENVEPMLACGVIKAEFQRIEEQRNRSKNYYGYYDRMSPARIDHINQMRQTTLDAIGGPYIWLTAERYANTATKTSQVRTLEIDKSKLYFEFDSEEIGAQKWHYRKKTFTAETARICSSILDKTAKEAGDNPYCYWICETAVPIALAKPTGIMAMAA
jgi:hypothetical protein